MNNEFGYLKVDNEIYVLISQSGVDHRELYKAKVVGLTKTKIKVQFGRGVIDFHYDGTDFGGLRTAWYRLVKIDEDATIKYENDKRKRYICNEITSLYNKINNIWDDRYNKKDLDKFIAALKNLEEITFSV